MKNLTPGVYANNSEHAVTRGTENLIELKTGVEGALALAPAASALNHAIRGPP